MAQTVFFKAVLQLILPKSHFVTALIVKYKHELSNHFGVNYVLSQIIRKFWLCGGVSTIRKYIADCLYCKIRRAKCENQFMGDLPACHVTVSKFPFEHTGVDLFGPYSIKIGRSIAKRWGVLFICMAIRACHIEVVPDLSTSSFIQCFWRFTSRGEMYCRCLYSDQSSNFKGCKSEFKELTKHCKMNGSLPETVTSLQDLDRNYILQYMLRKNVDVHWNFNVPKTPHAGGGWECDIKSVKYVLAAILHNGLAGLPALKTRSHTDYEFITIMCEVEGVLNCRSITKLNNCIEDWRALKPIS